MTNHDRTPHSGVANRYLPDLTGRVAVVTGASSPIGSAITHALSACGAAVLATGRSESALADAASDARASWFAADATDASAVQELREVAEQRHGPVDLLVTAAGGGGRPVPLAGLQPDDWRATIERNLTATFLALREFVPPMAERGDGAVVTVSSDAAIRVSKASIAYASAKAAVVALTRDIAAEVAGQGVRVNCLAPGSVRTPAIERAGDDALAALAAGHPSGRLGTVDDVADAALFLLSGSAGWITGHTLDLGARVLI